MFLLLGILQLSGVDGFNPAWTKRFKLYNILILYKITMNHTNNEFENGLEKPNSVIHTNQDPINPALLSPVLDPNTPSELYVEHVSSENIIVDGEYSFNNDSILSYNSDINMSYTDLPVIIASNHSSAIHSSMINIVLSMFCLMSTYNYCMCFNIFRFTCSL